MSRPAHIFASQNHNRRNKFTWIVFLGGVLSIMALYALHQVYAPNALPQYLPASLNSETSTAALLKRIQALEEKNAQLTSEIATHVVNAVQQHGTRMSEMNRVPKAYPDIVNLPSYKRKKILVTGGAGFVGSHLVDVLMTQGHYVVVMDNLFTGRMSNIEQWLGHPHFTFLQKDVTESFYGEFDQIYHLACPASPPHYQADKLKTILTSTHGTLNMLELAQRIKARILFTSTSEVYGDPEVHPQSEEYWGHVNPIGPRACYDEGKRVAETMCYAFEERGVEVRVARIFNTYGPRMHPEDGRVVSNFVIQSLLGEPLTVYGSGEQTRSFQYISDLVRGLVKLMHSDYSKPVNIGTQDEYTILDFARKVRGFIHVDNEIVFRPLAKDDPKQRRANNTLAKSVLNWEPVVPLEEGLQKTVEYFRRELQLETDSVQSRDPESYLWIARQVNSDLTPKERGL